MPDSVIDEIEECVYFIAQDSVENALRWHNKIEISINKLDTFPDRCPVAEEDQYFDFKVRQLVIGNYRALFRIKISGISADEAATIASSSEGA